MPWMSCHLQWMPVRQWSWHQGCIITLPHSRDLQHKLDVMSRTHATVSQLMNRAAEGLTNPAPNCLADSSMTHLNSACARRSWGVMRGTMSSKGFHSTSTDLIIGGSKGRSVASSTCSSSSRVLPRRLTMPVVAAPTNCQEIVFKYLRVADTAAACQSCCAQLPQRPP